MDNTAIHCHIEINIILQQRILSRTNFIVSRSNFMQYFYILYVLIYKSSVHWV